MTSSRFDVGDEDSYPVDRIAGKAWLIRLEQRTSGVGRRSAVCADDQRGAVFRDVDHQSVHLQIL